MVFIKELAKMKESDQLISVFSDIDDTNIFSVGFISSYNNEHYILKSITPHGKYDGFLLRKTNNILKIGVDGFYERKIQILIDHNTIEGKNIDFGNDDLINKILTYALQNQFVVAIELVDSGCDDCTGFVSSIEDEQCTICNLNRFGEQNGTTIIAKKDITKINVDSEDEQDLKVLFDANNNK